MGDPLHPQDPPDRLTRLEATVEALAGDMKSLAITVRGLAEQQGRPNYNALALVLTIVGGFGTIGYFAFESAVNQTASVEARSSMRHEELSRTLDKVEAGAASDNRSERDRNNALERALGRLEGFAQSKEGYRW